MTDIDEKKEYWEYDEPVDEDMSFVDGSVDEDDCATDQSSDSTEFIHEEHTPAQITPEPPSNVSKTEEKGAPKDNTELISPDPFQIAKDKYEGDLNRMLAEVIGCEDGHKLNDLKQAHAYQISVARVVPEPFIPTRANKPEDLSFVLTFDHKGKEYNLLPRGGVGALIGAPGVGKSSVIGAIIGNHENPETDAFGFRTHCGGKIVVVDTELYSSTLWEYMG